jgi:hypothetical protein
MVGALRAADGPPKVHDPYAEVAMRHTVGLATACGAAAMMLASCSSDPGGPSTGPSVIVIQPANVKLLAGQSLQFSVTTMNAERALRASDVLWSSSDARVAAVSKDGVVKGGAPGAVEIRAWWNGVRGHATVVVLEDGERHTKCLRPIAAEKVPEDCGGD